MIAKNYSTDKVDISKGYALFVGGELIVIDSVVFNGGGDINSGTVQWVADCIADMVSGAPKKLYPKCVNSEVNFNDFFIVRRPTSKQEELTEKLESAARDLAQYLYESRGK